MDWKIQLTKWRPRYKLVLYLGPVIIIDIILILTNNLTLNALGLPLPVWDEYKTTMTFDGKLTYKEDDLTFLIDNGNKSDSKTLVIYGLNRDPSIDITASHITDETTNTFENLTFDLPPTLINRSNEFHHQTNVSISEPLNPGSYQGWIFIKSKGMNLSIPVNVETGPQVYMALAWVVVGILTSIIFWEIIKYAAYAKPNEDQRRNEFDINKKDERLKGLKNHEEKCKNLLELLNEYKSQLSEIERRDIDEHTNYLQQHINRLRGKIEKQQAGSGPVDDIVKDHDQFIKESKQYIRRLKKAYKGIKHKEIVDHEQALLDEERSFNKKLYGYMDNKLSRKTIPHIAIIDGGTIGFGIAVGFLGLLSQGYVTGIRVITPIHILALIGLGLAIGSLREYVYKASQPS